MIKVLKSLLAASLVFLGGCSSIINGSTESMAVTASPVDATITLRFEGGAVIQQQKGSLFYSLKRSNGWFDGADYLLEISSEGYETQIIPIESSLSGWYVGGNIFIGGLIGWLIVDPATGGMWALEAANGQDLNSLRVTLVENTPLDVLAEAKKIN